MTSNKRGGMAKQICFRRSVRIRGGGGVDDAGTVRCFITVCVN